MEGPDLKAIREQMATWEATHCPIELQLRKIVRDLSAYIAHLESRLQTVGDALEELEIAVTSVRWDLREGLGRETAYAKDSWMRNALRHLGATEAELEELGE